MDFTNLYRNCDSRTELGGVKDKMRDCLNIMYEEEVRFDEKPHLFIYDQHPGQRV